MNTLTIEAHAFQDAGKLCKRLPFAASKLPVLNHVEVRADKRHAFLTVATLNIRLTARIKLVHPTKEPMAFLLPPEAFRAAMKADGDSLIEMGPQTTDEGPGLALGSIQGGMALDALYPTLSTSEFPPLPELEGPTTLIPAKTLEDLARVAPAASTDSARKTLNGVFFSPEKGGMLVATDGKRLAATPAVVPMSAEFVLPSAAVKVLAHRHFTSRDLTVTVLGKARAQQIRFHSETVQLTSSTLEGNFPKWQQVVPANSQATVSLAPTEQRSVRRWLTGLKGSECTVSLRATTTHSLELVHGRSGKAVATVEVPARVEGPVPVLQLEPKFLATALHVGAVLHFGDALSPLVVRNARGGFCVVMPMRPTVQVQSPQARALAN
ncbi:DNA polymerase III subunit beta [Roseibacillus ishigakijimensis]|uniref:Beta sliding clamp n=1 Tax=Roseibacillus ishigakijimensis TaxID=454146 RepID=A0A934VJ05_9BACT|nr:DNA polymerase III subunit beta [Roseibacillus ishigakijimensis]MBK1835638.1 hypothetical protein [Roseibacillus ishigakijimensis]